MPGGLFRTWISWPWPPLRTTFMTATRALRAAETVKAPELQLMAQTEAARALFHSRQYGKSAELLRSLVETTPAVLSIEFARAVSLLLQALMPMNPGRDALNSVLDRARRRLSLAAAASVGDSAADTYQNAVQDELDVLQLLPGVDGRGTGQVRAGSCSTGSVPTASAKAGTQVHDDAPGTHAGILLLALASQGLSVRGKSADAVALSTRALNAVERLPRCSVDFHSTVLTIHASNLTRLGQAPGAGSRGRTCRHQMDELPRRAAATFPGHDVLPECSRRPYRRARAGGGRRNIRRPG